MLTARSIFERALDVHATDIKLWSRYVDAELREKNIAHARNLLDRAVTILPRVNQLWFKYVRTEEALKDVARTREVYERWMKWQPDPPAWNAYINFERIAVNLNQIAAWHLPTRPTKTTDSRARGFGEISVELDAIEPNRLRSLVKSAIERHLPPAKFATLKAAEKSERALIAGLVGMMQRSAS